MTGWSSRAYLLQGFLTLGIGLGGFVAWASLSEISSAVSASGYVGVAPRNQSVQHPDGGSIAEIHVQEGATVAQGQPLMRLDDTRLKAQKALVQRRLHEAWARLDRFQAEIRGDAQVAYRPELRAAAERDSAVAAVLSAETRLFELRRGTLAQTYAQFEERSRQSAAAIEGRRLQRLAQERQLEEVQGELDGQERLYQRGIIELPRVSATRREKARLEGEIGELDFGMAEGRSAIAGFEVERLREQARWLEAASAEMRALEPQEVQFREELGVVQAQIDRLVLRAPMAGSVLGLRAHTVGGVIRAGEAVAAIVPADAPLIMLVEIPPVDVDRVRLGQEASIRFPNFNARTTPEIAGFVDKLSADVVTDEATGRRYFTAELALAPAGREALKGLSLSPGMPVEAFIGAEARSPASFLLKPVTDYMAHAMLEE